MKRVVGVSIGSSHRNHEVEIELLGQRLVIERRGTDGDLAKAEQLIKQLDGHVDCIGLGGLDLYIFAGGRRYTFREAKKLAAAAQHTPVVDGSGLKDSLERWVVRYVRDELGIPLRSRRVLMVAGVDRFGMAEELAASGCHMVFGDLVFALGVPIPLHSLESLGRVARWLAPVVTQLPFKLIYPTGTRQTERSRRYEKYFQEADLIAGDYHFIRRYMPDRLTGKGIVTNTVTEEDVAFLADSGAEFLVTTTPNLSGRSFGTNVVEAALVALSGGRPGGLSAEEYLALIDEINFHPRVERFDMSVFRKK